MAGKLPLTLYDKLGVSPPYTTLKTKQNKQLTKRIIEYHSLAITDVAHLSLHIINYTKHFTSGTTSRQYYHVGVGNKQLIVGKSCSLGNRHLMQRDTSLCAIQLKRLGRDVLLPPIPNSVSCQQNCPVAGHDLFTSLLTLHTPFLKS